MNITKKEVITKVDVEIEFNEFWEKLVEVANYFIEHETVKPLNLIGNKYYYEAMENLTKKEERYNTMNSARNIFESPLSDVRTIVVAQFAEDNYMTVSNYGYYNKAFGTLNVVFQTSGSHIE